MTTVACITAFCCQVDDPRPALPTPPHALWWPRAAVPLGILPALTGGGHRAFSRWRTRASRAWWPRLPERPRRLRLCSPQPDWPQPCLAPPTGRGVLDTEGLEVRHPGRAGRRPPPRGRQGPESELQAIQRPVGVGRGVGVGHRHGRGAPLAGAQAALGRAPAPLERDPLPGPRGGSRPAHTGSARCGAGPPVCGNGVREVDAEPSRHAGQAPWVGVLPRPPRVHDGGLQGAGPVAWLPAQQVRCRTPLDG